MNIIKKFESFDSEKELNFQEATEWIKSNYSKGEVNGMYNDGLLYGGFVDEEIMEDEGLDYQSYYDSYGKGEIENQIVDDILNKLKSQHKLSIEVVESHFGTGKRKPNENLEDWILNYYAI